MWRSVIHALEDTYRIVIPRLPIFDLPVQQVNIEYIAEVLHEFLEWHQLNDVTLVGHEAGGQIALMYAHQYPHNLKSLVLTGSTGLSDNIRFDADEIDYDFVSEKVKSGFYNDELVTGNLVTRVFETVQQPSRRYVIENLVRSTSQNDVRTFLSAIRFPVLLLWGIDDKITPLYTAYHFLDMLPDAELHTMKECGHLPMIEQGELFNEYLKSFLKD